MNTFSIRPEGWIALARAVILTVIVWFLWPTASAQALGLSSNDIAILNRSSTEAVKRSSSVLKSLNGTIGGGVGTSDLFEQTSMHGSVTISVNLSSLTANLTAPSKSPNGFMPTVSQIQLFSPEV